MMSQNLATFKLCLSHSICQIQMSFLKKVKTLCPKTCILDTKFVRQTQSEITPDLQIKTPMEKLNIFL